MQKYLYFGLVTTGWDKVYTHSRACQVDLESFKTAFLSHSGDYYCAKSFEGCYNPINKIRKRNPNTDYIIFQLKRTENDVKPYVEIDDLLDSIICSSERFFHYFKEGWMDLMITEKKSEPIRVTIDIISIFIKDLCGGSTQNNTKIPFEISNLSLRDIEKRIKTNVDCEVVNTIFRMKDVLLELDNGDFVIVEPGDRDGDYHWRYSKGEETITLSEKYSVNKRWEDALNEN